MKTLPRTEIVTVLNDWQNGILSSEEVNTWVNQLYPAGCEFDDWENNESDSIAKEIIAALDCMDMNLITNQDIPAMIIFLKTTAGKFDRGMKTWEEYLDAVDLDKRKKELADDPLYSSFCK